MPWRLPLPHRSADPRFAPFHSWSDTLPPDAVLAVAAVPVRTGATVIGVLSVRDLLKEIVEHHERLIRNMELEKMTILNQSGSTY